MEFIPWINLEFIRLYPSCWPGLNNQISLDFHQDTWRFRLFAGAPPLYVAIVSGTQHSIFIAKSNKTDWNARLTHVLARMIPWVNIQKLSPSCSVMPIGNIYFLISIKLRNNAVIILIGYQKTTESNITAWIFPAHQHHRAANHRPAKVVTSPVTLRPTNLINERFFSSLQPWIGSGGKFMHGRCIDVDRHHQTHQKIIYILILEK